jgi:sulfate transport system permease protein
MRYSSTPSPVVLPGFRLTFAVTLIYLAAMLLAPLGALFFGMKASGPRGLLATLASPRVLSAFGLSFSASFVAALLNSFFGLLIAWVLVRYRFPGRRLFDALIDLPLALPTAVAGIALSLLYSSHGWIGAHGLHLALTRAGIVMALLFVTLPFAVRAIEPVLQDFDRGMEEAALLLGANRAQIFLRVILPQLLPSLFTGFTLALARGLGEYGSVIFIAGNLPGYSEILPLLIVTKLEQYDYAGACALASVMLVASFLLLLLINQLQARKVAA